MNKMINVLFIINVSKALGNLYGLQSSLGNVALVEYNCVWNGFIAELFFHRTCGWCQSPGTEGCERSVNRTESENVRRGLAQQNLWTKASHQDQDRDRCDSNKSSKSMFFFSISYTIIFKLLFAKNYN